MSKKRPSADANDDDDANGVSDQEHRQEGNHKRLKFEINLEDLPIELLKCILVKAVVMEVKDMRLAKSVWKEKADVAMNRLNTVCSRWSNICATKYFRNEVHRTLDATAQDVSLEALIQLPMLSEMFAIAGDEIFMIGRKQNRHWFELHVYDRNDVTRNKAVIPLPNIHPVTMAACGVNKCVYILHGKINAYNVMKISTDSVDQSYDLLPLISDLRLSFGPGMSVSADGNLTIISKFCPSSVMFYDVSGSFVHEIILSPTYHQFNKLFDALKLPNGNALVASGRAFDQHVHLKEMASNGKVLRTYRSGLKTFATFSVADEHNRIVLMSRECVVEFLDAQYNLIMFTDPHSLFIPTSVISCSFHYNYQRRELAFGRVMSAQYQKILDILRFAED